jgi:hypothetical protein
MKRLLLVLLVLATFISDPPSASACDRDVPPIDLAIRQADVIFSGPATRIEATAVTGVLRVNVYVRESFKGQPDRNFTIDSHPYGGSCLGYDFRVGREYVIFAMANDAKTGPFQMAGAPRTGHLVYLCSGTAE